MRNRIGIGEERKARKEQSPEIFGRSTTKRCIAGSIVRVQLRRRPQRRGERAGDVAGPATSTGAAGDGRVKGMVLEAAAGSGGKGRRGGDGHCRGGRR